MSNIDKMTANEQLFTVLTPEEGAVVEGGAQLQVRFLWVPGSPPPENDPIVQVGRKTVAFKEKDFNSGTRSIFKTFDFTGDTTLSIWDEDPGPNNDDLLGSRRIGSTPMGVKSFTAGGYRLSYRVR